MWKGIASEVSCILRVLNPVNRGKVWTFFELLDLREETLFTHGFIDRELAPLMAKITPSMYEDIDSRRREILYGSMTSTIRKYVIQLIALFDRAGDIDAERPLRKLI